MDIPQTLYTVEGGGYYLLALGAVYMLWLKYRHTRRKLQ